MPTNNRNILILRGFMRFFILIISIILLGSTSLFAKITTYYKVEGKKATFKFILSETEYQGQRVLLSEGYSTVKYGIFYKGGFDFRGYNTLDGDMILNVKCNWKSKRSKSECVRVKFNGNGTFYYYHHKSSDLSLNEDFIKRSSTQLLKISDIQPGIEADAIIYDASSLIPLTPYLDLDRKSDRSMIIYTNYKQKISKSKVWIESERGDIQTIRVTPIYPTADTFKTLIIKIFYNKKTRLVESFIQKIPVLGNITVVLTKVERN